MKKNIILCGVGGQGTILASRLIAAAAMEKELPVRTAETIGMAQRGGSVFSHIRIGQGVSSPLIAKGEADLIIGFEPGEAVRQLPYLKEGGTVVTSISPVMPVSAMIGQSVYHVDQMLAFLREHVKNLILVDADKAAADLGSARTLNVVLLGAAVRSRALGIDMEDMRNAVRNKVPARFAELNERALSYTEKKGSGRRYED